MGFRFIEDGPERGDCTAPYRIDLGNTPYTVEDFINEILVDHARDWGFIKIFNQRGKYLYSFAYRKGSMIDEGLDDNVYHSKVKSVSADGGWTRMDYSITVNLQKNLK